MSIKHILTKGASEESAAIEDIQLFECTIDGDVYEEFLQYCPHLKRLSLKSYWNPMDFSFELPLIGVDESWMYRKYPMLEYFGFGGVPIYDKLDDFHVLFKQNPNIRKFAFEPSHCPWLITSLKIEVDDLAIICYDFEIGLYGQLYENLPDAKFFKRLQLYNFFDLPDNLEPMRDDASPFVEKVLEKVHGWCSLDLLANMKNLKILCVPDVEYKVDVVRTLIQLEKVSIVKATVTQMEEFIVNLPKLNTITVKLIDGGNIGNKVLKWDRERKRLAGACKVTVYVPADVFLAVKWAAHETNSKLVELKRLESYSWDHDFGYPQGRYKKYFRSDI